MFLILWLQHYNLPGEVQVRHILHNQSWTLIYEAQNTCKSSSQAKRHGPSLFSCSPVVRKTTIKGIFYPCLIILECCHQKGIFVLGMCGWMTSKPPLFSDSLVKNKEYFRLETKGRKMETSFCMTRMTKSIPLSLSDGGQKWRKSGKMDYGRPNQDKW